MKRFFDGLACFAAAAVTACAQGSDAAPADVAESGAPACEVAAPPDVNAELGFADGCGQIEVTYQKRTPTVALLIDQSGSMSLTDFSPTRYLAVRDALVGSAGVLPSVECDIRLGATLYHSNEGFLSGDACPLLTSTTTPFAIDAVAAITKLLDDNSPIGQTPTAESITAVADQLAADSDPGPKFIVLATDGEPDTCDVPEPKRGQLEAIIATQIAFTRGIRTYVISVGTDVTTSFQQQMANAGAGLSLETGNAELLRATPADRGSILNTFNRTIYGIRSCYVELDGSVKNPKAGYVYLDGDRLSWDNDWRIDGDSVLELLGAQCTKIQTGTHDLKVLYQCGDVVPR